MKYYTYNIYGYYGLAGWQKVNILAPSLQKAERRADALPYARKYLLSWGKEPVGSIVVS